MGICARCGNQRDPAGQTCPHCGATALPPNPQSMAGPPHFQSEEAGPPSAHHHGPPVTQPRWPHPQAQWFSPGPGDTQRDDRLAPGQVDAQVPGGIPPTAPANARPGVWARFRKLFTPPPGYQNVFVWLVTGMLRNKRGLFGALLASWFNLPIAVMLGGFGLVAGGIFGYIGGAVTGNGSADAWFSGIPILSSMLGSALLQGGGILGMLAGAGAGALGGFLAGLLLPWIAVLTASPSEGIGRFLAQLLVAFLCGFLYTLWGIASEGWMMRVSGARRPSRRERELIEPILQECAQRMGLASLPTLLMDDDRIPNAAAGTRHIIINKGFLDTFDYDPEPLAGVLCHELTHWRNADAVSSYFIRGVALPLYIAYNVCTWLLSMTRGVIQFIVWLTTWPLLVSIRYVVMPLQASGNRAAEYLCDQGAVFAGYRDGLRRVLAHFRSSFDGARNGWDESVLSTHPPNELRLESLEEPGVEYPLPDPDSPAAPMPVIVTSGLARD